MAPPRGKPRGFRKDRDCLTCKDRKIKCDLNRPNCGPCSASGLNCRGYNNRIRWVEGPGNTHSTVGTVPIRSTENCVVADKPARATITEHLDWTTDYRQYLQFFAGKFAEAKRSRASCGDILECKIDSVWELISFRVSGTLQHSEHSKVDFLSLHAKALNELGRAIQNGDILAIFGIVTLSYVDLYEGPFVNSERHLRGARALLDIHGSSVRMLAQLYQDVPGLKQAMSLLIWYDVMEAFIENKKQVIFEEWQRKSIDDDFFHMVQCPKDTFELYTMMTRARAGHTSEPLVFLAFQQVLHATQDAGNPSLVLRNSWRYSAAIAALGLSGSGSVLGFDETMTMLADKLCDIIEAISPLSGNYRHLVCHATVLGTQSRSPRHQRIVDAFWENCQSLPTPIFPRGRLDTSRHWKQVMGP